MTANKRFGVQFASIFLVVGLLVFLAFLPRWVKQTQFTFKTPPSSAPGEKSRFDMNKVFPVVSGGRQLPPEIFKQTSLAQLAAQSPQGIIINFWATWCPPCLDELPALDYLGRQLSKLPRGKMPVLVTVSVDEAAQDVLNLFKTLDFSPALLVLHDPEGNFSAEIGTTRFPETYWIDASGEVRHKWVGPQNWLSEEVLLTLKTTAQP